MWKHAMSSGTQAFPLLSYTLVLLLILSFSFLFLFPFRIHWIFQFKYITCSDFWNPFWHLKFWFYLLGCNFCWMWCLWILCRMHCGYFGCRCVQTIFHHLGQSSYWWPTWCFCRYISKYYYCISLKVRTKKILKQNNFPNVF